MSVCWKYYVDTNQSGLQFSNFSDLKSSKKALHIDLLIMVQLQKS